MLSRMAPLRATRDRELAAALRARGGRITPQRLVIAQALRSGPRHVTAEGLLEELGERLPGLSLPTVYATLALLEELGLVRRVTVAGGVTAYDTRTDEHDHMRCRRCGAVRDLDVDVPPGQALEAAKRAGFRPERAEVLITGLCERCAHEVDREAAAS